LVLSGRTDNVRTDPVHASGATLRFARSSDSPLAVSRDGRLVFTTDERYNGSIRRLDTGTEVHPLTGHGAPMNDAVFAPDGQWVVSVEDLGAFVWDVATGKERNQLPLDNRGYRGLLSPDQRLFAVVADTAHTRIWEVGSWRRLPDAIGSDRDSAWAKAGAWSPDSTQLAVGDNDGTVRVWDVRANRLVAAFPAHRYGVTTVAFSPDGALLLTTGLDERARIWNPSTGQLVAEVAGGPAGALFTPDGRRIATIAPRGSVSVYPWEAFAPVGTLERLAALRVKRALTSDERERYLHEPRPAQ
jgi:WD40 repeat protein